MCWSAMLLMLNMLLCITLCATGPAAQFGLHLTSADLCISLASPLLVSTLPAEFGHTGHPWSLVQPSRLPELLVDSLQVLLATICCLLGSMHCVMARTHQEVEQATMPCRAYQQVDLLNSLQSYMLTPRTPCGHASRLREQQQQTPHLSTSTMNPVVMSYLASSRLSSLPASYDVFAQVRNHARLCFLVCVSDVRFCTF